VVKLMDFDDADEDLARRQHAWAIARTAAHETLARIDARRREWAFEPPRDPAEEDALLRWQRQMPQPEPPSSEYKRLRSELERLEADMRELRGQLVQAQAQAAANLDSALKQVATETGQLVAQVETKLTSKLTTLGHRINLLEVRRKS
jgi:DNA repair exonuclease SbcCD ATPase subunit